MRTFAPTRTECAARLGTALQRHLGNAKDKRKLFARDVGENHRTVDGWVYGDHTPPINKLVVLMAACPGICDEIMALVEEVRASRADNN